MRQLLPAGLLANSVVAASSANLGPGFDALAVALTCYVEVSVEPARRLALPGRITHEKHSSIKRASSGRTWS